MPLEKNSWVPLNELYWFLFLLLLSCCLNGTGTGDGTLLQISVSQSVDHCDVPSGAAPRVPWQQYQTIRPLVVVTDQPVWFLHAGNADLSQSAPNDSNSVGVFHGCRPSSSVVFCNGCIVAKRCKRGPRLLLITNKKSNIGFQMTLKSMTLDDLERTIVCQSCGIVATR